MSINAIIFSGNAGKDMEVRTTPNGKYIGSVGVCTRQGWGDNQRDTWVEVKLFGERAQKLAQYITKGAQITVQGQFTVEESNDKQSGEKRQKLVCIADQIQLPPKGQSQPQVGQTAPVDPRSSKANDDFDDDIPFS